MEIRCMDCNCVIDEDGRCACTQPPFRCVTPIEHEQHIRTSLDRIAASLESIANTLAAIDRRMERGRYKR